MTLSAKHRSAALTQAALALIHKPAWSSAPMRAMNVHPTPDEAIVVHHEALRPAS